MCRSLVTRKKKFDLILNTSWLFSRKVMRVLSVENHQLRSNLHPIHVIIQATIIQDDREIIIEILRIDILQIEIIPIQRIVIGEDHLHLIIINRDISSLLSLSLSFSNKDKLDFHIHMYLCVCACNYSK